MDNGYTQQVVTKADMNSHEQELCFPPIGPALRSHAGRNWTSTMYSYRTIGLSFATIRARASPRMGCAALTRYPTCNRSAAIASRSCGAPRFRATNRRMRRRGTFPLRHGAVPTTSHELTLTGLEAGKTYNYRVREGAEIVVGDPELNYFKTDAGSSDAHFSFFVTGDIGAELPEGQQVLTQAMIRNVAPRADFGLLCGDTIYPDGESIAYDAQLMTPWRPLLANTTVWPCLGNHDWHVDPDQNFCKEWALPNNEHWYSFNYGRAHFIALDSQDGALYDEANQLAWLRADLTASRGRYDWTFVFYHHPVLTCTYKSNIPNLAALLGPIFAEFKVDAVFNGHAPRKNGCIPSATACRGTRREPAVHRPAGNAVNRVGMRRQVQQRYDDVLRSDAAFVDRNLLFTQVFIDELTAYFITLSSTNGQVKDYASIRTDAVAHGHRDRAAALQALRQNMPNPFNPATIIPFEVARPGRVTLRIFQPDGSLVRELVDASTPPGPTTRSGMARLQGQAHGVGRLSLRLEAEDQTWSIKMVMVR